MRLSATVALVTRAALPHLLAAADREPRRVRVSVVEPGLVATELQEL